MIMPMSDLPSVLTRYSKNSLKDMGMLPKKIIRAYGSTCSNSFSLLPRKIQMGFKNTTPKMVNIVDNNNSTMLMKVKISLASCCFFWPSFSPIIAPDPVANMTDVPKIIQVIGITMLMPARASELTYLDTKKPSMAV